MVALMTTLSSAKLFTTNQFIFMPSPLRLMTRVVVAAAAAAAVLSIYFFS
jgi:hypothetical protein